MNIPIRLWKNLAEQEKSTVFSRSEIDISEIKARVQEIIDSVKAEGDTALRHYNCQFEGIEDKNHSLKVSPEEFLQAEALLSDKVKGAIDYSIKNIKEFHLLQKPEGMVMKEIRPGILAGEKPMPIPSAGLYVPRGRGSFPSMLYMLAIPAVIAGVEKIAIVTPPDKKGKIDPGCLYAARKCGVEDIYKTGGAQAIAALAIGTKTIPSVCKIIGPGSMYVAAAKRLLTSIVDVGLPAGPSESAILADGTADPWKVALDLMIEAEHGSDSSAILVTPSMELGKKTAEYIATLTEKLPEPRKSFVTDVFSGYGGIFITEDLEEAADIINNFAPEHLQIQTSDPFRDLSLIKNAGEILLGENTPFSIANYSTGPNAVLPTGGKAKTYSAVSVRDFIKYSSVIYTSPTGLADLKPHVEALADYEGFITHGNALKKR